MSQAGCHNVATIRARFAVAPAVIALPQFAPAARQQYRAASGK